MIPPKHEWETYLQLRKRFSWGYGFAVVDADGTTLTVRVSFNCL